MQKRTFLALAPVAFLTACGFRLRGVAQFSFQSLFIAASLGSAVAKDLQRTLVGGGGDLKVLRDPTTIKEAQAILDIVSEQRERAVVGLNVSGQIRELQLRLRVRFRLRTNDGRELIPETELLQQRDVSYNESLALAKEAEEALLYRNMQSEMVQQLLRRLEAVKY
jgi:LPS-assembly lipoprotein